MLLLGSRVEHRSLLLLNNSAAQGGNLALSAAHLVSSPSAAPLPSPSPLLAAALLQWQVAAVLAPVDGAALAGVLAALTPTPTQAPASSSASPGSRGSAAVEEAMGGRPLLALLGRARGGGGNAMLWGNSSLEGGMLLRGRAASGGGAFLQQESSVLLRHLLLAQNEVRPACMWQP